MIQSSLFEKPTSELLASRMRTKKLEEFVGQRHVVENGKRLRNFYKMIKYHQ